jgi:hypothetical protein
MSGHKHGNKTGMVVPVMHGEFSVLWRRMHTGLGLTPLKNGMRRSAISYTLVNRRSHLNT